MSVQSCLWLTKQVISPNLQPNSLNASFFLSRAMASCPPSSVTKVLPSIGSYWWPWPACPLAWADRSSPWWWLLWESSCLQLFLLSLVFFAWICCFVLFITSISPFSSFFSISLCLDMAPLIALNLSSSEYPEVWQILSYLTLWPISWHILNFPQRFMEYWSNTGVLWSLWFLCMSTVTWMLSSIELAIFAITLLVLSVDVRLSSLATYSLYFILPVTGLRSHLWDMGLMARNISTTYLLYRSMFSLALLHFCFINSCILSFVVILSHRLYIMYMVILS